MIKVKYHFLLRISPYSPLKERVHHFVYAKNAIFTSVFSLKLLRFVFKFFAEAEGFEPPVLRSTTVFKTAAFDHSATPL